jgi:hypothetical protein
MVFINGAELEDPQRRAYGVTTMFTITEPAVINSDNSHVDFYLRNGGNVVCVVSGTPPIWRIVLVGLYYCTHRWCRTSLCGREPSYTLLVN